MGRGSDHRRAQLRGKERDGYVCQCCGSTDRVEGHHIIDYHFGGAADADNIITLCHACHMAAHRGEIDIVLF